MLNTFVYDKYTKRAQLNHSLVSSNHRIWIDVYNPTNEELKLIKNLFNFDNKIIENYRDYSVRPSIQQFSNNIASTLYGVGIQKGILLPSEIIFVLGRNYIITMHKDEFKQIDSLIKDQEELNYVLKEGIDYLFYYLSDQIIDNYFPSLDRIDEELDVLEAEALGNKQTDVLKRLFKIKSQFLDLKNVVYPQRDKLSQLSKLENKYVSKEVLEGFRETYDHMLLVTDLMEVHRETISNIMELHLSVTSNRLNENMKVLTIIATMFMPITFIASVYGMNFKSLPLAEHGYGFWILLGIMFLVFLIMLSYFRRKFFK